MHGDWYYVSPFEGELPNGLTLRNCWRWRFNGMAFVDAGPAKPASAQASLLASNKDALLELLNQRIDAVRRPFEPSSLGGAELRAIKLAQARSVLSGEGVDVPVLREAAAANLCTCNEMAQRIVALDRARSENLLASEAQREVIAAVIARATTQPQLMALRARIVEEIASTRIEPEALKADNTTPEKLKVALSESELGEERLRLRLQLRNRVNDLRRPCVSHYLLDEHVIARKTEIAVAVQRAGGALPLGLDGSLLMSHAAARGLGLAEAARDVLDESRELRRVLVLTEQMKDATLARIAGVRTRAEVRDAGRAIEALVVDSPASAATHLKEVA